MSRRRRRAGRDRAARNARQVAGSAAVASRPLDGYELEEEEQPSLPDASRIVARAALLAAIAFVALPIAAYAYTGYFTRYWADDYCIAAHLDRVGFVGSMEYWFNNWTGRFGSQFSSVFITYLGPGAVRFYAPLLIAVWSGALIWACYEAGRLILRRRLLAASAFVAGVILFSYLALIPNRNDGLYWVSGGTNYTVPLVIFTFNAGLLARTLAAREPNLMLACVVALALGFLAGGFAEAFIVWQLALLVVGALLTRQLATGLVQERLSSLLGSALLGAMIATTIVYLAPGNDARMRAMGNQISLVDAGVRSTEAAVRLIPEILFRPEILLAVAAGAVIAAVMVARGLHPSLDASRAARRLALAAAVAFVLVVATFGPTYYYLGDGPSGRGVVPAVFTLILFALYTGYLLGRVLGARIGAALMRPERAPPVTTAGALLVFLALAVITLRPAAAEAGRFGELSAYAAGWDERHRHIEEVAGDAALSVAYLPHRSGLELRPNADAWMNGCAAFYYGVPSITAVQQ
jgi:hypothetical protein